MTEHPEPKAPVGPIVTTEAFYAEAYSEMVNSLYNPVVDDWEQHIGWASILYGFVFNSDISEERIAMRITGALESEI